MQIAIEDAEAALGEILRSSADAEEATRRIKGALVAYKVVIRDVVFDAERGICVVEIIIQHPEEGSVTLRGAYADPDEDETDREAPQPWFSQQTVTT